MYILFVTLKPALAENLTSQKVLNCVDSSSPDPLWIRGHRTNGKKRTLTIFADSLESACSWNSRRLRSKR